MCACIVEFRFKCLFIVAPHPPAPKSLELVAPPQAGTVKKRGPQAARCTTFDVAAGVDLLTSVAEKSTHTWDWDGNSYPKPMRRSDIVPS